jgi:two-component system, chemotaxis family, CheB/CheR fusion protein
MFSIVWQESGGPAVTAPEKIGFGGTLIERSLPGAKVHRNFAQGGVICTVEIELPEEPENG